MIKSLLVANRGEIAVRIVRACKELGIRCVAVFSEADKNALHVKLADRAVCIGPPASKDSYLNMDNLISAALHTDCDAIHPGVGFLSENPTFARKVKEAGIIFIGPEPEVIELVGDKVQAKASARRYDVPVIPGGEDSISDPGQARKHADQMGYPVIVKAASGGGGKGMRIVYDPEELEATIKIASHEAQASFNDGRVYLEKYLVNPRHVEVQILADAAGNVVHLGERDCSVQKNHQKLVEESPSPIVTPEMRNSMGEAAVRLFAGINYTGAGTIEYLVVEDDFYFMEVNARVQVEHPVTEMVTGVDIIQQQILIAGGEKLPFTQKDVSVEGYAVECRINAMAPGTVTDYLPPGGFGTRIDSFLYKDYMVSPFYDSMVAKVIVSAENRNAGLDRMARVLDEFVLEGVPSNISLQRKIVTSDVFRKGKFGTDVLQQIIEESE